jgi:hypothetical protein
MEPVIDDLKKDHRKDRCLYGGAVGDFGLLGNGSNHLGLFPGNS